MSSKSLSAEPVAWVALRMDEDDRTLQGFERRVPSVRDGRIRPEEDPPSILR